MSEKAESNELSPLEWAEAVEDTLSASTRQERIDFYKQLQERSMKWRSVYDMIKGRESHE